LFKIHNSFIYISAFLPLLLITGPFLPDLVVSVFSIYFLFYIFKIKNFYYFNNKPLIIFFIFCFYCLLITFINVEDNLLNFKSSLFYFRIGLFSCLIWYLIEKDKSILKYFYYALIISFSVLVIDGYFQFFTGANILNFPYKGGRISSLFGDELIMGSYLSRLFPLFFALFLIKKKYRFETYYIGILFILIDILIYISGERTSFFFLNISTIFIIILIKEYQIFRLITFLVGLVLIVGLTLTNDNLANRMIKNPIKSMGLVKDAQYKNIFTPKHDSHIRTAFNMFLDKPILGHGPKMFRFKCSEPKYAVGIKPCSTHPHNFYVQLLAETGIIGFSFLFSAFCYVLYCAYRQLKSIVLKKKRYLSDYQVCLLAGIFITVWPFSPNGNFFNNWLAIVYSLPIGFYLQSIYSKKIRRHKKPS